MSYDVTLGNNILPQYVYEDCSAIAKERRDLDEKPNSLNLLKIIENTYPQYSTNTRHQNPLSARVILCTKTTSENSNNTNTEQKERPSYESYSNGAATQRKSDWNVQQEISVGVGANKNSNGNSSSQADLTYEGSAKNSHTNENYKWKGMVEVERKDDGTTSCKTEARVSREF